MTEQRPLWSHQQRAIDFLRHHSAAYLAWEMGTGKTRTIIEFINHLRNQSMEEAGISMPAYPANVLIVCPKSVIEVWRDEIEKWATVPILPLPLAKGTTRKREETLRKHLGNIGTLAVIVNYDAIHRSDLGKTIAAQRWDVCICDEVHRIKSPSGVASRFMSSFQDKCSRRIGLSGTPMPHSPLDLYAQMRWIDKRIFGTSNTIFKSRYAILGGFRRNGKPVQVVGYKNQSDLNRRFYTVADRILKEDVLDLPPKVTVERLFDLDPVVYKHYKQIESGIKTEIRDRTITTANALVRTLRLQEITGGSCGTDGGAREIFKNNKKADVLEEVLGDIDKSEPVVVFCRFRHDLNEVARIAVKAGRMAFELSGAKNEIEEWKDAAKSGAVFAVQIQAGGLGIDLTLARFAIYYSCTWSLGDYDQSAARIHRPNQDRPVKYIHLLARGTIDFAVFNAIKKRRNIVDSVLDHLNHDMEKTT
jgi:SNF2 family DNA or RNA helicase